MKSYIVTSMHLWLISCLNQYVLYRCRCVSRAAPNPRGSDLPPKHPATCCGAVQCSALQCYSALLQCSAMYCTALLQSFIIVQCSVLQCSVTIQCSVLQCGAVLQCIAVLQCSEVLKWSDSVQRWVLQWSVESWVAVWCSVVWRVEWLCGVVLSGGVASFRHWQDGRQEGWELGAIQPGGAVQVWGRAGQGRAGQLKQE